MSQLNVLCAMKTIIILYSLAKVTSQCDSGKMRESNEHKTISEEGHNSYELELNITDIQGDVLNLTAL